MPEQKVVKVGNYSRVVSHITVEFTCVRCGQKQVYTMYPGPKPKYCFSCFPIVRREQAKARKARQRQRQHQENADSK